MTRRNLPTLRRLGGIAFALFVTGAAVPTTAQPLSGVAIGAAAPDFTAVGADGRPHRLSDYRGATVVLEWTSPICEVTAQFYDSGKIQGLQKDAARHKVVWLAIDTAAPGKAGYLTSDAATRLVKTRAATVTAFLFDRDGKIGRQYGAKATPSAYIVNANGVLVYQGAVAASAAPGSSYVQAALDDLAAGKPVSTPLTAQRGCPVEY